MAESAPVAEPVNDAPGPAAGGEDGYTLADALAALAIIGLALGGLTQVGRLTAHAQRVTARDVASASSLASAGRVLAGVLPRTTAARAGETGFTGDALGFRWACDAGEGPCAARLDAVPGRARLRTEHGSAVRALDLGTAGPVRFLYLDAAGRPWPRWPDPAARGRLWAVALVAGGEAGAEDAGRPLALARLWTDQPADCAFDAVRQDCLTPLPVESRVPLT